MILYILNEEALKQIYSIGHNHGMNEHIEYPDGAIDAVEYLSEVDNDYVFTKVNIKGGI